MIYSFFLGHQHHISQTEIFAVLHRLNIDCSVLQKNKTMIIIKTSEPFNEQFVMNQLGGTVSISEKIELLLGKTIQKKLTQYLFEKQSSGKIVFALEGISPKVALQVKKELKKLGRSVRYVQIKNTASIIHNDLIKKSGHLRVIDNEIYVTRAVQAIAEFSQRDYDRPGIDSKSGMLPPKLARILINLTQKRPKSSSILDPYCGSGTVLMEAAVLGFTKIMGSDILPKAIADSKKNIEWIKEKNNLSFTDHIFLQDVQTLTEKISRNSIDTIVFEPYMGKPLHGNESLPELKKQAEELKKLYIRAFQQCFAVLHPAGVLVGIIPRFKWRKEWIIIDIQKELKNIGFEITPFTKKEAHLLYHRQGQHVGREIWRMKKS